jgi:hypothetical protein
MERGEGEEEEQYCRTDGVFWREEEELNVKEQRRGV